MLVGRAAECARLEGIVEGARGGRSGALIVRGEPGVGKTALLEHAVDGAAGMTVLRARGIESESDLPFAGLSELLGPLTGRLGELPPALAAGLGGALALGPPAPADPFALGAATLALLAAAAEERPLLAAVDDAHWLDGASLGCIAFAAQRIEAEGVAVVIVVRAGEPQAVEGTGLPEMAVEGLAPDDARALLERAAPEELSPEVAEALLAAAAGNPLALAELPALLTPAQRAGAEPLDEPLPAGRGLDRAFARRIGRLPGDAQRMLLVAAAAGSGEDLAMITAAAAELGIEASALEAAQDDGLVAVADGRLEFRHPLARGAVYGGAEPAARRDAHRALAAAAHDDERRAWHRAAAALGPDEAVARDLEALAGRARARGDPSTAARALERAARLTPGRGRADRMAAAAAAALVAGRLDAAAALVAEADPSDLEPRAQAELAHVRGLVQLWGGHPIDGAQILRAEAERIRSSDPGKAAVMLAEASSSTTAMGDVARGLALAEEAYAVGRDLGGLPLVMGASLLAQTLALAGRGREGLQYATIAQERLEEIGPWSPAALAIAIATGGLTWAGEYGRAETLIGRMAEAAAREGAVAPVPVLRVWGAKVDYFTGAWRRARVSLHESAELARQTGQVNFAAVALAILAALEAAQGREEACRASAASAMAAAERLGLSSIRSVATSALGLLELGLGRVDEASGHLRPLGAFVLEMGVEEPSAVQWAPNLIEADVRAGRRRDAEETLALLARQAERSGVLWGRAAAARGTGLLADDGEIDEPFGTALELHARARTPFERARTELCYGERLRRARRRVDAREQLRPALETFERLGAGPWAERARAELAATGERARPRREPATDRLTPTELRVALVVAEGFGNRDAARRLFLSPRTVEFHLGQIYRKLGLRSRAQLARLLGEEAGAPSRA
jgi:DNA-binding CsgD family transcriptional regulator